MSTLLRFWLLLLSGLLWCHCVCSHRPCHFVLDHDKSFPLSCFPSYPTLLTSSTPFATGRIAADLDYHIAPDLPVQEAVYYVQKCSAVAVLTGSRCAQKGSELAEIINISRPPFQSIPIHPHVMKSPLSPGEVIISSDCYLDINRSGLVIFTSGTTGPPKGAVKRRGFLTEAPQAIIDAYELTPIDTMLHILPVHHATGIGINLLPLLLCGGCIEFRNGSFDAAWTWERWRQGGLTFFSGVPTIYMRMMQYFERNLAHLPTEQLDGYVKGARQFRALLCGTSALPRPLQQKWTKLRDGKRIITRYGATEFGTGFMVPISPASDIPETSVGTIPAGTELKLSNGDEGEVLIKSPSMISK
jgi:malonyl-CoA/methylmalonyl-CoA synthetase